MDDDLYKSLMQETQWLKALLITFDSARAIVAVEADLTGLNETQLKHYEQSYLKALDRLQDGIEEAVLLGESHDYPMPNCIQLFQALNGESPINDCFQAAKSEVNFLLIKVEKSAHKQWYLKDNAKTVEPSCDSPRLDPFERHYDDIHSSWTKPQPPPHKHIGKTFFDGLSIDARKKLIEQYGNTQVAVEALAKKSENLRGKRKRESRK